MFLGYKFQEEFGINFNLKIHVKYFLQTKKTQLLCAFLKDTERFSKWMFLAGPLDKSWEIALNLNGVEAFLEGTGIIRTRHMAF